MNCIRNFSIEKFLCSRTQEKENVVDLLVSCELNMVEGTFNFVQFFYANEIKKDVSIVEVLTVEASKDQVFNDIFNSQTFLKVLCKTSQRRANFSL